MLRAIRWRQLAADSLVRNSTQIMGTTVVTATLGYLYWTVVALALPAEQVGTASSFIAAATAVSTAANLGVGHMFIQRLPRLGTAGWGRLVAVGTAAACASTALAAVIVDGLLAGFAPGFHELRQPAAAGLVAAGAVGLTASLVLDHVFIAQRASGGMLSRNLTTAVVKLALLGLAILIGAPGVDALLGSWVLAAGGVTAVTLGWMLPRLRPGARLSLRGAKAELGSVRRPLAGHHLINVSQALPTFLLPILVTVRLGPQASAHFYLTWMVAAAVFMVSPAVSSALFAERSHRAGGTPVTARRAARLVAALIIVPCLVLVFGRTQLLTIFGAGYANDGAPLLAILAISAVPDAVTNLAVGYWRSEGRLAIGTTVNTVMAVACLTGTWFLLPSFGIAGAGLAWLAAQTCGSVIVGAQVGLEHRRPATRGRVGRHRAVGKHRRRSHLITARTAVPEGGEA